MNIGMLWFDNDAKTDLGQKIQRAAIYYAQRYGKQPDLCYVHPSMAPELGRGRDSLSIDCGGIEVKTTKSVLPNHLWIGMSGNAGS